MKAKNRLFCLVLLAALCISFGGFAMAETYASREEVLMKAGFTEKDVEFIDVDQFILDEQITVELLAEISEENLRNVLQEMINRASVISHEYLFTEDHLPFSEFDIESEELQHIAIVSTNDALLPSLLVDFSEGKAYFSNGNLFVDINLAENVTVLDSNHLENIMNAVNSANVWEWIEFYVGDMLEYPYYEAVAIQTNEGIYRYEKTGHNTNAPDTTTSFMLTLYNMFW